VSAAVDLSGLGLTPEEEANVLLSYEMLRPKLEDGERRAVEGSKGAVYELHRKGATLSCSCPAWRNQTLPVQLRTCKHLKAVLGERDEDARVREAARAAGRTLPASPYRRSRR